MSKFSPAITLFAFGMRRQVWNCGDSKARLLPCGIVWNFNDHLAVLGLWTGGPDFLIVVSILVNVLLIALAVLQWVVYLRAFVDFRIDQLRQEQQSRVSPPPPASAPAS